MNLCGLALSKLVTVQFRELENGEGIETPQFSNYEVVYKYQQVQTEFSVSGEDHVFVCMVDAFMLWRVQERLVISQRQGLRG